MQNRMSERQRNQLPIFASRDKFIEQLQRDKILLVIAEANSGKSTQLPQYAAECFADGLVVCVLSQPFPVMNLARRAADEYDGTLEGNSVGYQISHSNQFKNGCISGKNIMFMTDTALIYEFKKDPNLSRIHTLIIDDIHERLLNIDIVMGIAKLLLAKRTNDFFVVISSSNIDPVPFLKFFDCPLNRPLVIKNQINPVNVKDIPPPNDCPDHKFIELHVIPTFNNLYQKYTGHILIFLSSQREIERALQLFNSKLPKGCVMLSLHGSLSIEEQNKILELDNQQQNQRMIVFCTNITEISCAINKFQVVIDTGLIRQLHWDNQQHFNILETVHISRFSANQSRYIAGYKNQGH
ncbi:unnamed protein product [Rotaria sp. Silwood2]|nr:unnamed protein product [Rotaria sp. Silwood2]CAF4494032.1 unnamed protein product [Rotaria sp. Silwood2]